MEPIIFKAHVENDSQIEELKAFMKTLKIKFEIAKEKPYDSAFVDMVQEAEIDIKKGKGTQLSSSEFDELWK